MQQTAESAAQELLAQMRAKQEEWENRTAPGFTPATPEQIEYTRKYWETVFSSQKKEIAYQPRQIVQEMEYEAARKSFWRVLEMRAAEIMVTEQRNDFEWRFDEQEKDIIRNLVRYFINDPASKFALSKGLFLYGAPGTGKTEIMEAAERFCRENDLSKAFEFSSMSRIYDEAKADKNSDPVTPNVQRNRCFDEFARYVGEVSRFGDKLDINEAIIEQRYNRFRKFGQITHFITNSTPNDVAPILTPMLFDRLRSMCTSISFTGKSKRN